MNKTDIFRLTGKTALVTGGSRGLGLALAKGLARHGANVITLAREETTLQAAKSEIEGEGGRCHTFVFDLHNVDKIPDLFDRIVRAAGPVDILVNSAGINKRGPAEEIDLLMWEDVLRINLTAVLAMSQAFCKHRKSLNRGGKIVNVGSLMCHGARPSTAPYAASKGGLLMLTKTLAVEWAPYHINVNAIGPGYFATEMTTPLRADEKLNAWVLANTPLARWGDPDDLTGAVVFLASEASAFITGQILYVDGGWTAGL